MPKSSSVHRCFDKLRKERGDASAAKICQASTGLSLSTGQKPKKDSKAFLPRDVYRGMFKEGQFSVIFDSLSENGVHDRDAEWIINDLEFSHSFGPGEVDSSIRKRISQLGDLIRRCEGTIKNGEWTISRINTYYEWKEGEPTGRDLTEEELQQERIKSSYTDEELQQEIIKYQGKIDYAQFQLGRYQQRLEALVRFQEDLKNQPLPGKYKSLPSKKKSIQKTSPGVQQELTEMESRGLIPPYFSTQGGRWNWDHQDYLVFSDRAIEHGFNNAQRYFLRCAELLSPKRMERVEQDDYPLRVSGQKSFTRQQAGQLVQQMAEEFGVTILDFYWWPTASYKPNRAEGFSVSLSERDKEGRDLEDHDFYVMHDWLIDNGARVVRISPPFLLVDWPEKEYEAHGPYINPWEKSFTRCGVSNPTVKKSLVPPIRHRKAMDEYGWNHPEDVPYGPDFRDNDEEAYEWRIWDSFPNEVVVQQVADDANNNPDNYAYLFGGVPHEVRVVDRGPGGGRLRYDIFIRPRPQGKDMKALDEFGRVFTDNEEGSPYEGWFISYHFMSEDMGDDSFVQHADAYAEELSNLLEELYIGANVEVLIDHDDNTYVENADGEIMMNEMLTVEHIAQQVWQRQDWLPEVELPEGEKGMKSNYSPEELYQQWEEIRQEQYEQEYGQEDIEEGFGDPGPNDLFSCTHCGELVDRRLTAFSPGVETDSEYLAPGDHVDCCANCCYGLELCRGT